MKMQQLLAVGLALVLGAGVTLAEKALKSGPQVGEELAGPFHPLNVNGKSAGKKFCLYCSNGSNPVAMIFARETSEELAKLCKEIDKACEKNSDCKMGSFVVFCSSDEGLEDRLKKMAKDSELKKVVLSIDNPAGPEGYKVSKDADVTVVLYLDRTVKANYAFKKGELKDKQIEEIVKATSKIVPSK
ncbi:MAG: hypothetical protein U0840_03450 [Gemmataceae bacterium]